MVPPLFFLGNSNNVFPNAKVFFAEFGLKCHFFARFCGRLREFVGFCFVCACTAIDGREPRDATEMSILQGFCQCYRTVYSMLRCQK